MNKKKEKKEKQYQDVVISYYLGKNKNKKLFNFIDPIAKLSVHLYNQMLFVCKTNYDHNQNIKNIGKFDILNIMKYEVGNDEYPNYYNEIVNISSDTIAEITLKKHFTVIESFDGLKSTELKLSGTPQFPNFKNTLEITKFNFQTRIRFPKGMKDFNSVCIDKDGEKYLRISKKQKGIEEILLHIPSYCYNTYFKNYDNIKEITISFIPILDNKYKIQISYRIPIQQKTLDKNRMLFIDLGTDNFASCITTDPTLYPFILNGKEIKSYNQLTYNKTYNCPKYKEDNSNLLENNNLEICKKCHKCGVIAKIKSDIDLQNDEYLISPDIKPDKLHKIISIRKKRIRFIRDIFHKYSNFIIEYCNQFNIGTIIIGENKGWKQKTKKTKGKDGNRKFGKNNTRKFQYFPYNDFKFQLEYKSKINNIQYKTQEESYTSQVDHIMMESIEFHPSSKIDGLNRKMIVRDQQGNDMIYKDGKKKYNHHLFKSKSGYVIHADINGAIGIGRKYVLNLEENPHDFNIKDHIKLKTLFTPIKIKYNQLMTNSIKYFNWNQLKIIPVNSNLSVNNIKNEILSNQ